MNSVKFAIEQEIAASPAQVYHLIADYHYWHPRIISPKIFTGLEVTAGGYGAGTQVTIQMKLMGQTQILHAEIEEPQPGQVLLEKVRENNATTTFRVLPAANPAHSLVSIQTEMPAPAGLEGKLQGWLLKRLFLPAYREEMTRIAEFAPQVQLA